MAKLEVMERIKACGLVTAVRVQSELQALTAVEALGAGGVPVAEVTMSMPNALRILEQVVARFGGSMLIGAGTVLNAEMASQCIAAGAQFVVTPGMNVATIEQCGTSGIPIFAGALTPTEIAAAWSAGADCVKVFPVHAMGGVSYIKSIQAPLPFIELLPMGGVTLESAADYINAGCFALGVGSDLVSTSLCEDGGAAIMRRAAAYREVIAEARKH
jgi:2-dehydro-3-deoxyphosphogluconate aldolase/(4S)-4-hydroxy-2-oxoglutarate aldolase